MDTPDTGQDPAHSAKSVESQRDAYLRAFPAARRRIEQKVLWADATLLTYSAALIAADAWLSASYLLPFSNQMQPWLAATVMLTAAGVGASAGLGRFFLLRSVARGDRTRAVERMKLAGIAERIDAGLFHNTVQIREAMRKNPHVLRRIDNQSPDGQLVMFAYNADLLVTPDQPQVLLAQWASYAVTAAGLSALVAIEVGKSDVLLALSLAHYLPRSWWSDHHALKQLDALQHYLSDAWGENPRSGVVPETALATIELEHGYGMNLNAVERELSGIARPERGPGQSSHPFSVVWLLLSNCLAITAMGFGADWTNTAAAWLGFTGFLTSDLLLRRTAASYRGRIRQWLERQRLSQRIAIGELTSDRLNQQVPKLVRRPLTGGAKPSNHAQPGGLRRLLADVAWNISFLADPRPQTCPHFFTLTNYFPGILISTIAGFGLTIAASMQDESWMHGKGLALFLLPFLALALPLRHAAIQRTLQQGIAASEFVSQLKQEALGQAKESAPGQAGIELSGGQASMPDKAGVQGQGLITAASPTATSPDS